MATVSIPGQETAIPHAVQCGQTKYFFKKEQYVLSFVYFTTTKSCNSMDEEIRLGAVLPNRYIIKPL